MNKTYAFRSPREIQRIADTVRAHESAHLSGPHVPGNQNPMPILWAKVVTAWAYDQTDTNLVEVKYAYADGTDISTASGTDNEFKILVQWPPTSKPSSPLLKTLLAEDAVIPFTPFGLEMSDAYGILAAWHHSPVHLFPVDLSSATGAAGDKTTKCTYTYTVKDLTGTTIATTASPISNDRPAKGKLVAATKGLAYISAAGTVVLYHAYEALDPKACS